MSERAAVRKQPASATSQTRGPPDEAPALPRPRRTQAERSATARAKVLAAAIRLLHEGGYSAANVKSIAHAAGLSLGSLQHHYATKAKLMAAVVSELTRQRVATYRRALKGVREPRRRLSIAYDASWDILRRPEFAAVLEIMLARRSDPELHAETERAFAVGERRMNRWILSLADASGDDRTATAFRRDVTNSLMYGLAMRLAVGLDPAEADRQVAYWKALLHLSLKHPELLPPQERAG